jgi:hypothetical protein
MSFDSYNATWTKFLHSELVSSSQNALKSLLRESEMELAKLFSSNGIAIPFQGNNVQTLVLRHVPRRDSSAGSSLQSEFDFIATPGSTSSDVTVSEKPVDEAPAEEAIVEAVAEEFVPIEQESQEPDVVTFDWDSWGTTKKDKKKKKARFFFDGPSPAEECPAEAAAQEPLVEAPPPAAEVCSLDYVTEETPALEPSLDPAPPEDDFGWGSFATKKVKKDKKGKKNRQELLEIVEEPAPAPEPAFNDDGWGSWGAVSKKSKKDKAEISVEIVEPTVDEAPPPPPESQPVIEDDLWGSWGAVGKKSKKKKSKATDASIEPVSEPMVGDDVWAAFSTKKDKKKISVPETHSEAAEDEWSSLWQLKRSKKDKKTDQVPLVSEAVEYLTTAPSPPVATSEETTTHTTQLQTPPSRQTVVFTIQYPNDRSIKPLQAMITLEDNTRVAIFDALNSYLDSKSDLRGRNGQRRLEITTAAGKNGDVDLSALEESMWPDYLTYFRQYTWLPELTVDVVEY